MFLLIILANGWEGGKQVLISFKNLAPTFVETFSENGGLNHTTSFDLFLFFLLLFGLAGGL